MSAETSVTVQIAGEVSARVLPNASNTALLHTATATVSNVPIDWIHSIIHFITSIF